MQRGALGPLLERRLRPALAGGRIGLREPTNSVGRRYGVTGFPETFFISARERIVGHVIGVADAAKLAEGIAAARGGRVIGAEHGGDRSDVR